MEQIIEVCVPKCVRKLFQVMQDIHSRYCDYPCFCLTDLVHYLILRWALPNEIVEKDWQDFKASFGNVSWGHFIHSFDDAFMYLLNQAKEREIKDE